VTRLLPRKKERRKREKKDADVVVADALDGLVDALAVI
jgi:hypothetical protein